MPEQSAEIEALVLDGTGVTANTWQSAARRLREFDAALAEREGER